MNYGLSLRPGRVMRDFRQSEGGDRNDPSSDECIGDSS